MLLYEDNCSGSDIKENCYGCSILGGDFWVNFDENIVGFCSRYISTLVDPSQ